MPRRRIVVKYGFKKLVYMRSIASPEIVELLKKDNIINPIHFIKNYLHNLHKLFRGRIQDDLSWKSGTWDDKIARIIKNDAPHRILTKAEVNQIYMVLELTIADFDDICLHLGFTTQLTPSEIDMFNTSSQLEYESLYGKFSKSCRPNLLRVYYDYIKYAQAHFATHFLASIGRGESEYYRASKIPMLFVNEVSLYVVSDIEKMRLSFLYIKSHLQFLINKRDTLDEFINE